MSFIAAVIDCSERVMRWATNVDTANVNSSTTAAASKDCFVEAQTCASRSSR